MSELVLVRHAQASFGEADYDRLSPLGHEQAARLGAALALQGFAPERVFLGGQRRHRETLEGMAPALGLDPDRAVVHEGLNEFDAQALLETRFPGGLSEEQRRDRRTYFRILRETVIAWQKDEIDNPPESFSAFTARVLAARDAMVAASDAAGGPVLAVSSGGAISRLLADALSAPAEQMILLQLQMKNCAVSRLVGGSDARYLHAFNETPHLRERADARLLTYA